MWAGPREDFGLWDVGSNPTELPQNQEEAEVLTFKQPLDAAGVYLERGYDYPYEDLQVIGNVPDEQAALQIFMKNPQADMFVYTGTCVWLKRAAAFANRGQAHGMVAGFRAGRSDEKYEQHVRTLPGTEHEKEKDDKEAAKQMLEAAKGGNADKVTQLFNSVSPDAEAHALLEAAQKGHTNVTKVPDLRAPAGLYSPCWTL